MPPGFDVPNPHQSFKGIALFTPGGDLAYCIDPHKSYRWHLQLCVAFQEALGLSEPPHFLVSCYTATLDYVIDSHAQTRHIFAEACPRVIQYQSLLNAVFGMENLVWNIASNDPDVCDLSVLQIHRQQFPELWDTHDLIIPVEAAMPSQNQLLPLAIAPTSVESQGCVLRLFVAGNSATTEKALKTLYEVLEHDLQQPYTLKVIDVQRHPEQAEYHQISATPTLMRVWPLPVKRIVGRLDDIEKLRQTLEL